MADEYGINSNGFNLKRLPEIKSELEEAAREALGSDATLLPDSPEGVIISIFAEIYSNLWEQLQEAYGAFNPIAVSGQTLDNLCFLNGLSRLPPIPSNTILDITGVDNTVVPAGSIVRHVDTDAEFVTTNSIEIGVGFPTTTAQVYCTARKNGAIEALAGTLTDIGSPVNGWETVINNNDAELGRDAETDQELRARRNRSLSIAGSASLDSIISEVARVAGVLEVNGVENFTDAVDSFGLPPHSFEIVALGGIESAIGSAIWNKKPAGIEAHGDVSVGVIDVFGGNHIVKFTRPAEIQIHLRANITFIGTVPDDASDVMTENILAYARGDLIAGVGFGPGDDVIHSRLYTPLNYSFLNHTVNSLEISVDGVNWGTADIPIEYDELSSWAESRITLSVG